MAQLGKDKNEQLALLADVGGAAAAARSPPTATNAERVELQARLSATIQEKKRLESELTKKREQESALPQEIAKMSVELEAAEQERLAILGVMRAKRMFDLLQRQPAKESQAAALAGDADEATPSQPPAQFPEEVLLHSLTSARAQIRLPYFFVVQQQASRRVSRRPRGLGDPKLSAVLLANAFCSAVESYKKLLAIARVTASPSDGETPHPLHGLLQRVFLVAKARIESPTEKGEVWRLSPHDDFENYYILNAIRNCICHSQLVHKSNTHDRLHASYGIPDFKSDEDVIMFNLKQSTDLVPNFVLRANYEALNSRLQRVFALLYNPADQLTKERDSSERLVESLKEYFPV